MKLSEEIEEVVANKEIDFFNQITSNFKSHPMQLNQTHEADAEIINCKGQSADYLIVKTDGIHEEIDQQLYEDPYLIGWMSVTAVISDLAAVGSEPLGLLLSLQITDNLTKVWLNEFKRGVNQACEIYQTYVLGGDTNISLHTSINATGIATIKYTKPLMRKPIIPGDLIYSTGKLGLGNAYAYNKFFEQIFNIQYKPTARLQESRFIRNFANSCIDTSDGLFPALSILSQLNQVGIKIKTPCQDLLCNLTHQLSQKTAIPAWIFLAGPHGEYELLFTIPASDQQRFEKSCLEFNWQPLLIGEAVSKLVIEFDSENLHISSEPAEIANLYNQAGKDVIQYFKMLMQKQDNWRRNE